MAESNGTTKPIPWQRTPEGREKMRRIMKARWARNDPTLMKGAKAKAAKKPRKVARRTPAQRAHTESLTKELRALAAGSVKSATSGRAGSPESVAYIYKAVEGLVDHHAKSTGCDPGDIKTRIGLMFLLNR